MKRITPKTCRSCFCVTINKHSFESFMCLDLVLECYQTFLFQIFCFHDSCIKPVVWWQHWPVSEVGETAVQRYPTWRRCSFQSHISALPQRWCQWTVAFYRSGLQPVPIIIRVPVPERESQAEGCTPLPLDAGSGEIPAINKQSGQLPPSDMVSRFFFVFLC